MTMQNTTDTAAPKMTAIEKALAAARAKKAAREAAGRLKSEAADAVAEEHDDGTVTLNEKVKKAKPAKEPKVAKEPPADKAAAKAQREAERLVAKQKRDDERIAKKAAKALEAAAKKSTHMSKVDRAASKLPVLTTAAEEVLGKVKADLPLETLTALALHIQHFVRVSSTVAALSQKLEVGQQVRIVGGDPKFVGKTGTVTKAARLRCFVDVGGRKPVYLFTSDVAAV